MQSTISKLICMVVIGAFVAAKTDLITAAVALAVLWMLMPYAPTVIYLPEGSEGDE
jgi:hypothetical protein